MSPMRSPVRDEMKLRMTFFATVIRLGETSSASIESDMSNTIIISRGIFTTLVTDVETLVPAMIDTRNTIIERRMIQSIHMLFGVLRYFAIMAFGATIQIRSRPKIYQRTTIIGMSIRMRGEASTIIFSFF